LKVWARRRLQMSRRDRQKHPSGEKQQPLIVTAIHLKYSSMASTRLIHE
jgi:hypothetical protein